MTSIENSLRLSHPSDWATNLASFHMNAVPFYVMVIVVLSLGRDWDWMQAIGAALVAVGVLVSQSENLKKF